MKYKIIRTATIASSLNILLKGQLNFLSKFFKIVTISSDGADLTSLRKREDVKTISINMERGISPLKDLVSLFKLYNTFKKERPQIVHSITPKAGLLSMLAAKFAGVPIRMHTFTGLIFPSKSGLLQKLLIKMDQLLCWSATDIYPEGLGVKSDLLKFSITNKPLKVLANGNVNGIDTSFFSRDQISEEELVKLKSSLRISSGDFIFVFVGRLVGDKGINELINAFSNLSNLNCKLLLVGEIESKLDPLDQVTLMEIDSNQNIISVGFQQDVRPYFAISDALVFPSYREGFPNVVMQAGAMELPSIVTDINGCNEIIEEGVNGVIIPVKNTSAIRNAMVMIMDDVELYKKLKKNSRKMISERYEQHVVWNALLEEYNNLLVQHGFDSVKK